MILLFLMAAFLPKCFVNLVAQVYSLESPILRLETPYDLLGHFLMLYVTKLLIIVDLCTPVKFTFHYEWIATPMHYTFVLQSNHRYAQSTFHEWISRDVCQPLRMLWYLIYDATGQLKHEARDMNSLGQLPRCFICKFLSFLVAQVVLRAQCWRHYFAIFCSYTNCPPITQGDMLQLQILL